MVDPADKEAAAGLLLEMAFQAEALIAHLKHFVIHRAVGIMAGGAAFAHGLMFKHERPALGDVAFKAGIVFRVQRGAAPFDGRPLVGIMAVAAAHPAFRHQVVKGEFELSALVQMAFKTILGGATRIDNGLALAAGSDPRAARPVIDRRTPFSGRFHVKTGGAVAGFAAHIQSVGPGGH